MQGAILPRADTHVFSSSFTVCTDYGVPSEKNDGGERWTVWGREGHTHTHTQAVVVSSTFQPLEAQYEESHLDHTDSHLRSAVSSAAVVHQEPLHLFIIEGHFFHFPRSIGRSRCGRACLQAWSKESKRSAPSSKPRRTDAVKGPPPAAAAASRVGSSGEHVRDGTASDET
jgi:hypothetical protein